MVGGGGRATSVVYRVEAVPAKSQYHSYLNYLGLPHVETATPVEMWHTQPPTQQSCHGQHRPMMVEEYPLPLTQLFQHLFISKIIFCSLLVYGRQGPKRPFPLSRLIATVAPL